MNDIALPDEITAGDTLDFYPVVSSDYNPSTDVLTFVFAKAGEQITFNATEDSGAYRVLQQPATTNAWEPGEYRYAAYMQVGSDRYTLDEGTVTIKPNLVDQTTGHDGRSHVKKVLEALEATIERKATRDQSALAIEGQSISRMSPEEILKWYNHYQILYKQELQAEKIKKGLNSGNMILTRF